MVAYLNEAADAAGLLQRPRPHDIRYGGAYEHALLPTAILPKAGQELARQALGHSVETAESGSTDQYIGHLPDDTWSMRLNQKPIRRAKYMLEYGSSP